MQCSWHIRVWTAYQRRLCLSLFLSPILPVCLPVSVALSVCLSVCLSVVCAVCVVCVHVYVGVGARVSAMSSFYWGKGFNLSCSSIFPPVLQSSIEQLFARR